MLVRRPLVAALPAVALALMSVVVIACAMPGNPGTPPASAPTSRDSPSGGPSASGPDRPFRPTQAPSPTFATYLVRQGDTLLALAARFGTTAVSLAYWNRARYPTLDPESTAYAPNRIEAGWTLDYLPGEVVDPENLPPAAASSAPRSSLEPFPVLPADGRALLVTNGPRGSDEVALTFDYAGGPGAGAPTAAGADAVLQWLVTTGVTATVFVAPGAAGSADPDGNAVLARLAAAPPLVTAGMLASHPAAGTPWGAAVRAADARLAPILGRSTAPWLRVPGPADAGALDSLGRSGWTWVVGADVDAGDGVASAAGGPIAADIAARVISRSLGGSIISLTLGGEHTLEALPAIIDGLGARGLRVVPLPELLGVQRP